MIDGPKTQSVTEICINIKLRSCWKCPFVKRVVLKGHYVKSNYFCSSLHDKPLESVMEYTFPEELPPVPEWCPYRVDRKAREKEKQQSNRFIAMMKEEEDG